MSVVSASLHGNRGQDGRLERRRSTEQSGGGVGAGAGRFGAKVSQLKNIFQSDETGGNVAVVVDGGPRSHQAAPSAAPPAAAEEPSHVQRFRYTRAIFAAMEEKSRVAGGDQRGAGRPARRPATAPDKPRAASDPADMENMATRRARSVDSETGRGFAGYLGSLENLDEERGGGGGGGRRRSREEAGKRPQWLGGAAVDAAPPSYSQHVQARASAVILRHAADQRAPSGAAGVLLPKRRSQAEARLSQADIAASLNQADQYWQRTTEGATAGTAAAAPEDTRMTDSSLSSGSGEEMARSPSLTTPTTPPVSTATPPRPPPQEKPPPPPVTATTPTQETTPDASSTTTSPATSPAKRKSTDGVSSPVNKRSVHHQLTSRYDSLCRTFVITFFLNKKKIQNQILFQNQKKFQIIIFFRIIQFFRILKNF